ncbi:MAG: outer membrane beta-barrel protein [Acidobacteriota bacterium]
MPISISSVAGRTLILGLLAVVLLTTSPLEAADVTLRLQGQVVTSSASSVGLDEDFGSSPGAYLGAEFRLNDRFGIEVGAAWAELEESERFDTGLGILETEARVTFTPVTVALDIHLTPQKPYDLYVAPKIGWAFVDDLEVLNRTEFPSFPGFPTGFNQTFTVDIPTEDTFVLGLRVGFDLPFGDGPWSFSSSVDYLDLPAEISLSQPGRRNVGGPSSVDVDIDPLSIGAGVGYKF